MRLGKMREPHYRVVITDSRKKRDGRAIETIGKYRPKEDPSFIDIDGDRALHWLRVGAQPTEAVEALLKVTGTWQEFKGLPAPPPMKMAAPKTDKRATFEAAHKQAAEAPAEKPKARKAAPKAEAAEAPAADAAAEAPAPDAAAEAPAAETPAAATAPEPVAEAVPVAAEPAADAPAETQGTE